MSKDEYIKILKKNIKRLDKKEQEKIEEFLKDKNINTYNFK
ncbi:hypothetical protein [Staphylococcus hominis]|nr:hypothetical protein [Staphylococcus hominis]EHR89303.1 hypothetical protein SEVCU122_2191 [Staphylococcus hominis VCU122]MDS3852255.1 hypothetical protein [Staphylococcus hominis]